TVWSSRRPARTRARDPPTTDRPHRRSPHRRPPRRPDRRTHPRAHASTAPGTRPPGRPPQPVHVGAALQLVEEVVAEAGGHPGIAIDVDPKRLGLDQPARAAVYAHPDRAPP